MINLASDGRKLELKLVNSPRQLAWMDPHALFDVRVTSCGVDFFKGAAAHPDIDLTVSDPPGLRPLQLTKLSTFGLVQALEALGKCAGAPPR
jgi:hypothetical protein